MDFVVKFFFPSETSTSMTGDGICGEWKMEKFLEKESWNFSGLHADLDFIQVL